MKRPGPLCKNDLSILRQRQQSLQPSAGSFQAQACATAQATCPQSPALGAVLPACRPFLLQPTIWAPSSPYLFSHQVLLVLSPRYLANTPISPSPSPDVSSLQLPPSTHPRPALCSPPCSQQRSHPAPMGQPGVASRCFWWKPPNQNMDLQTSPILSLLLPQHPGLMPRSPWPWVL